MGEIGVFVKLEELKKRFKLIEEKTEMILEEYEDYINLKNNIKFGDKYENRVLVERLTKREKLKIISDKYIDYDELKDYLHYREIKTDNKIIYYIELEGKENKIQEIFCSACIKGHIESAKWIYREKREKINIHQDDEYIFREVIEKGNLKILEWLYGISPLTKNIIINYLFRIGCIYGQFETVKWLYSKITNETNNLIKIPRIKEIIRITKENGYMEVYKWLIDNLII